MEDFEGYGIWKSSVPFHFIACPDMTHSQNSNKSTFGVQQVISEITLLPKDLQISTYANDVTITTSHINHHLSPTTHSTIFLQIITLFTPDPAGYGTTLII